MIKTTVTRTLLFSFSAAASLTLMLGSAAKAEMPVSPRKPASAAAKSAAGSGEVRFDWLARRDTGKPAPERVARKVALGNGSWVCSPAGFNRKSRCFKR